MRPSQGFWGTGKRAFISEEQRPNFEGNGNKDINIRKQIFDFWGTSQFISGELVPPGRASVICFISKSKISSVWLVSVVVKIKVFLRLGRKP